MMKLRQLFRTLWAYLREVSGENDYARYQARARARGERPLSPEAFYLEKLRRNYSRPNRCC